MPPEKNHPQTLNWSGLLLAVPAIVFLALYMTDTDFTLADQALAVVFVILLFFGTRMMWQQQQRDLRQRATQKSQQQNKRD